MTIYNQSGEVIIEVEDMEEVQEVSFTIMLIPLPPVEE